MENRSRRSGGFTLEPFALVRTVRAARLCLVVDYIESHITVESSLYFAGDRVRVLGEAYSPEDDEDMALATVEAVSIPRGRTRTDVTMAKAGNWVLIDGVDANISKTATITGAAGDENNPVEEDDTQIFAPLKFPQVRVSTVYCTYDFRDGDGSMERI